MSELRKGGKIIIFPDRNGKRAPSSENRETRKSFREEFIQNGCLSIVYGYPGYCHASIERCAVDEFTQIANDKKRGKVQVVIQGLGAQTFGARSLKEAFQIYQEYQIAAHYQIEFKPIIVPIQPRLLPWIDKKRTPEDLHRAVIEAELRRFYEFYPESFPIDMSTVRTAVAQILEIPITEVKDRLTSLIEEMDAQRTKNSFAYYGLFRELLQLSKELSRYRLQQIQQPEKILLALVDEQYCDIFSASFPVYIPKETLKAINETLLPYM